MTRSGAWAVGVDVGGTKIAAGLVGADGRVHARRRGPTDAGRGGAAVLADAVALAAELGAEAMARGQSLAGVGLALPELVDGAGRVRSAATVDLRGVDLAAAFAGVGPLVVDGDARAAARAEALAGAGRGRRSFLLVAIGTGVGAAFVHEGVIVGGARGCAGALASAPLAVPCAACGGVATATIETLASGPGLARAYGAATAEDVVAAAERGDGRATGVIARAAAALGSVIASAVNLLDPEAVVLAGGLGSARGPYHDALARAIRAHVWSPEVAALPVERAAHGGDAALVGAALACVALQQG